MAVTVTDLGVALRIITGGDPEEPQLSILTRLLGVAAATVEVTAPNAPEPVQDQAIIQFAGYLYDQPNAGIGTQYSAAFRNSGANSLLARWISKRAGQDGDRIVGPFLTREQIIELIRQQVGPSGTLTLAEVLLHIADWAETGNPDGIPADKLRAAPTDLSGVEQWAHVGVSELIPASKYRAPTSTARGAPYAVTNNIIDDDAHTAATLYAWSKSHVSRLIERVATTSLGVRNQILSLVSDFAITGSGVVVPDDRLPVGRLLPSPTGVTDGRIVVANHDAWVVGQQEGRFWRFELVRSEDIAGQDEGKVLVRLQYLDTYNNAGHRTDEHDAGVGYLTDTGSRTTEIDDALDVKALLAQTSVAAIMELVTTLPDAGDATWGQWYGLSDQAGVVEDAYYRREIETTTLDWGVERLTSGHDRGLYHGYAEVDRPDLGIDHAGGSLFPHAAGIVALIEFRDSDDNVMTTAVVNDGHVLQSTISIILFWDEGDGQRAFSSSREMALFHDTTYNVPGQRRYTSAEYSDFQFVPGRRYGIRWRNAGQVADLVLSFAQHMVKVADEDDLLATTSSILEQVYSLENTVEDLANRPVSPNLSLRHLHTSTFRPDASAREWFDTTIRVPSYDFMIEILGTDPLSWFAPEVIQVGRLQDTTLQEAGSTASLSQGTYIYLAGRRFVLTSNAAGNIMLRTTGGGVRQIAFYR